MKLGQKEIRNFSDPYIIAEIGANHNGDIKLAKKMIDSAQRAGCDCVKFQSWTKESLLAKCLYEGKPELENEVELYSTSEKDLSELAAYCKKIGIDFASSVFSMSEVDFISDVIKVSFLKIASMDLNNYNFISHIANKGLPVMLSTGLATLSEIDQAVHIIEKSGNKNIMILHCVANYPPEDCNVNLNNIDMLRDNYPDYPIGFSDHTIGVEIPLAAVAKGASVIEKHFTLDKEMPGWDHKVSATPDEMKAIFNGSKRVTEALGSYRRIVTIEDKEKIIAFRRSVVAANDIGKGKVIELSDLDVKRPGTGLEPQYIDMIVGRIAKRDIPYDKVIDMEDF